MDTFLNNFKVFYVILFVKHPTLPKSNDAEEFTITKSCDVKGKLDIYLQNKASRYVQIIGVKSQ